MKKKINLYFSDIFNVDPDILKEYGAFNISLINDLPLFVDPFLLFNSDLPEYQALHTQIIDYVKFLRNQTERGEINKAALDNWFTFPEIKENWLGFSLTGNAGSGLGVVFAQALYRNLRTTISDFGNEQITQGSHLEKLCLIKDGVGRDNISDFTTNLILGYLLEYTENFAKTYISKEQRKLIPVRRASFNYKTQSWVTRSYELPWYNGDYVLLTPKNILTKDETWINKSDLIDDFHEVVNSVSDAQLREQMNDYFRRILPESPKRKDVNDTISKVILRYPKLIDFYIRYKEERGDQASKISENRVAQTEEIFCRQLNEFISKLDRETEFYSITSNTYPNTYEETRARILFLKDVIENKGGHRLFFENGKAIRRESDVHILFRLTWLATLSDVSSEANDGRGPVDFKISRGAFDKTLVEFKLAKNTHLKANLKKQTEIYKAASDAKKAFKVILFFSERELNRVMKILKEIKLQGNSDIILIDANPENKPSGSKA